MAILYLLYALPVSILSSLSSYLQWTSVPFHLKLILPRLVILLLSLSTDVLFYRLMKIFYPKFQSKQYGTMMNYYGLAHVTLVFFTRTLSNSIEAFLFLTLIYLVKTNISAIMTTKTNRSITRELTITSSFIGVICALGIFNRPTFPSFALVPIIYWCINIIPTIGHSIDYHVFLGRIISLIVGAFVLTSSALILFDSYYYNNGFSFLIDLKNQLVICPLNFILYNIDTKNLDQHGLHPPWLHFLVNATILYGPLHAMTVIWSFKQLFLTKGDFSEQTIPSVLFYLYLIPFIPLSTFPHQEVRFLLPLIFPLILFVVPHLIKRNLHHSIFRLWFIFNIIVAIIYGHLHQAGLLPALRYVHNKPMEIDVNKKILITYHTYMPPSYLVTSMSNSIEEEKISTIIQDLKGAKREILDLTIANIFNDYSANDIQVFLILPAILRTDFRQEKYSLTLLDQFGLHLDFDHSFEAPFNVNYTGTIYQWFNAIWKKHQLDLYRVTYV